MRSSTGIPKFMITKSVKKDQQVLVCAIVTCKVRVVLGAQSSRCWSSLDFWDCVFQGRCDMVSLHGWLKCFVDRQSFRMARWSDGRSCELQAKCVGRANASCRLIAAIRVPGPHLPGSRTARKYLQQDQISLRHFRVTRRTESIKRNISFDGHQWSPWPVVGVI